MRVVDESGEYWVWKFRSTRGTAGRQVPTKLWNAYVKAQEALREAEDALRDAYAAAK